jgi:transcription elongation factor GreB
VSKAFTSEETPELEPVLRPAPRVAPGEVRYVTPEGHADLRGALERLEEERAGLAELSEAEREARRQDLARRLRLVEETLASLTVLRPDAAPPGTVAFGTWVTVEDEEGGRSTWRIVGPDEADARRGLVSVDAPVARSLLGHGEGETVEVERPRGPVDLTIVSVSNARP